MPDTHTADKVQEAIDQINDNLNEQNEKQLAYELRQLHPAEIS